MNALLEIREFTAKEFLQNCYCLELLKVCEIFSIFYLVMCNITAQKNITCQKDRLYKDRRVVYRVATGDNKWQRMTTSGTTNDNGTMNDNEWYN